MLGAGLALVLGHEIGRDILWSQGRQGVEGVDLVRDEAEDVFPGFVELPGLFEDRGLVLKRGSEVERFKRAVGGGFRIDRVVLHVPVAGPLGARDTLDLGQDLRGNRVSHAASYSRFSLAPVKSARAASTGQARGGVGDTSTRM